MLFGGSSQEAEANALTPAKRRGTTVFNLEEHYDENSVIRNSCSTRIKKEKTDKSGRRELENAWRFTTNPKQTSIQN